MNPIISDKERLGSLDIYLTAANSSGRSNQTLKQLLAIPSCSIDKILVFDYEKLRPKESNDNYSQLNERYWEIATFSPNVIPCKSDDDDVNYIAGLKVESGTRVGLDITGFTIPDIFRILYILHKVCNLRAIDVFYTEPKHYLFQKTMHNTYNYLSGERTYRTIPEYTTGNNSPEILICFLGFDAGVSNFLHEKVLPDETFVVNGFPSYLPKLKDISLLNNSTLLKKGIPPQNHKYTVANNPFSSYNVLAEIREEYPSKLMNICVLGTRPMALGACLFALKNDKNLKVTYPYPKEYASNTTSEFKISWHYEIRF